ncbi:hypothetical protein V5799_018888 [Amblyomma americanum]|uniref:Uncharacterized protein n=1 Tax=Amblyomma americanum TaxID=6943 RepID=A0AAQ4EYG7_AMBAM
MYNAGVVLFQGVAWATLLVCGLQLWHAVGRSLSNIAPVPLLPKSLDRCPLLANTTDANMENISMAGDFMPKNSAVFPLYQISYHWISLIGLMLTMVLGTTLSLVTGEQSVQGVVFLNRVTLLKRF